MIQTTTANTKLMTIVKHGMENGLNYDYINQHLNWS